MQSSKLKNIGIKFLGSDLASSFFLNLSKKKPLVVLYHGVTDKKDEVGINNYRKKHVYLEDFIKQIRWLKKHFKIVPLYYIEELALKKKELEEPLCSITFDDGYKNNYTNAFPVLKEEKVGATVFLTTSFIENKLALWTDVLEESINRHKEPEIVLKINGEEKLFKTDSKESRIRSDMYIRNYLKTVGGDLREQTINELIKKTGVRNEDVLNNKDYSPLSWQEILEMESSGISFGAHTENHPILSKEPASKQREEIVLSLDKLKSKIGNCKYFAYPNGQKGDWDEETKKILKELGFKHSWTTLRKRVDVFNGDLLEMPRVSLDNTSNFNRFKVLVNNSISIFR